MAAPLYERVFNRASSAGIMMFETSLFPNNIVLNIFGWQILKWVVPLGYKKPPGGEIGSAQHALNEHPYCCTLDSSVCEETGEPGARFA